MSFHVVRKIFELEENKLAKGIRSLKEKDVDPNNIERMKVGPALKVFLPEVSGSLQLYHNMKVPGFEEVDATIEFIETFHR